MVAQIKTLPAVLPRYLAEPIAAIFGDPTLDYTQESDVVCGDGEVKRRLRRAASGLVSLTTVVGGARTTYSFDPHIITVTTGDRPARSYQTVPHVSGVETVQMQDTIRAHLQVMEQAVIK